MAILKLMAQVSCGAVNRPGPFMNCLTRAKRSVRLEAKEINNDDRYAMWRHFGRPGTFIDSEKEQSISNLHVMPYNKHCNRFGFNVKSEMLIQTRDMYQARIGIFFDNKNSPLVDSGNGPQCATR